MNYGSTDLHCSDKTSRSREFIPFRIFRLFVRPEVNGRAVYDTHRDTGATIRRIVINCDIIGAIVVLTTHTTVFAIYYVWNQTHNPVGARELHYNCATPDKDTRYEVQLVFEFNSTTILTVKHTKKTKITKRRSPCTTCGPRTTVCAPPLLLLWQCNMIRAE